MRRVPGAAAAVTGETSTCRPCSTGATTSPSHWDDEYQVQWLEATAACSCAGTAGWSVSGASTSSCLTAPVRADSRRRRRSSSRPGSSAVVPPIDGLPRHAHVGQPRRHQPEGGARAAARARRWRRRRRDGQAWKRLGAREVTVIDQAPRLVHAVRAVRERAAARPRSRPRASPWCSTRRSTRAERAADDGPVTLTLDDGRTFTGDETARRHRSDVPTPTTSGSTTVGLEPGEADRGRRPVARARASTADGSYAIGDSTAAPCSPTWASTRPRIAADAILHGVDRRGVGRPSGGARGRVHRSAAGVVGAHRGDGARAGRRREGGQPRHRRRRRRVGARQGDRRARASWSSTTPAA